MDEDLFGNPSQIEENQDATEESQDFGLTGDSFSGIVVAPADWTISSLHAQIGKQIDLDPKFQRRNVWPSSAKSKYIESIFLGVPIPQILLSSRPENKNAFLVLDGKQRLLTLKEFLDDELKLKGLRVLKELDGKKWSTIKSDPVWRDRMLNETQRTAVIRNWSNEKVLYEIFYRLNSGSVKLSPMELRMSLHPGDFLAFVIKWTETIGPMHTLLGRKTADPRMMDVELAVRYLGFKNSKVEYNGDLKEFLDQTCNELNKSAELDAAELSRVTDDLNQMNEAIKAGVEIFTDGNFSRKYSKGKYETRFNRAVFDVQVGALSDEQLRVLAKANPKDFVKAFESASANDAFVRAVEQTTKTVEATRNRFAIFFEEIQKVFGVKIAIPRIRAQE